MIIWLDMKKYNILTVTPSFPPDIGGIADVAFNLNTNFVKQGHKVTIIATKDGKEKKSKPEGFSPKVFRINSIHLLGWPYPGLASMSFPVDFGFKIKSIMKKGDFDVVHVHAQQYPICWYAIKSAFKLDIPCVLTSHGMWTLDTKGVGKKVRLEDYFNKLIYSRLLKKTNAVIGLTEEITNFSKQVGNKETKYITIPNGANTTIYKDNIKKKEQFREEYQINKDSIVILFLGRFEKVKGIIEFANAVKNIIKNNQIEVLIVGEGSQESNIKSILNGVERIHFFPWQSPQEIHKFYIASDIFVIPSRYEGLPLTLIEAMNAGLHIVYTPVGGIPEVIEGYSLKTSLKITSSEEIQNVLTELISHYSVKVGLDEALNYARKFDWNNLAQETINVYDDCLNFKK